MVAIADNLTPLDRALLARYIESDSLKSLGESLAKDPIDGAPPSRFDLYLWAAQDHIAAWIAFHNTEESRRIHLEAVARLDSLSREAKDPIESRRVTTTLLRALRIPHLAGAAPFGPHPRRSPLSRATDPSTEPAAKSPPLPTPAAAPAPEVSDCAIAQIALSALRNPSDLRRLSTLRAFCTPKTLLAGTPMPPDAHAFADRATDILTNHDSPRVDSASFSSLPSPNSPLSSSFRLSTKQGCSRFRSLTLDLARESPDHPWLIAAISAGTFPAQPP